MILQIINPKMTHLIKIIIIMAIKISHHILIKTKTFTLTAIKTLNP